MDINITLIGEMITFGVLVWFTMRYVWPPIIKAINDRQQKIAEGLSNAERAQHTLDLARHESAKIVQEAHTKSEGLIDRAQQHAGTLVEDGKNKAREEAGRILSLAKVDIAQERVKVEHSLRQETVTLAVQLAAKILQKKVDDVTQDGFLDRLVEEIK
jgi:F-type H+-transporting ATPase subunit b